MSSEKEEGEGRIGYRERGRISYEIEKEGDRGGGDLQCLGGRSGGGENEGAAVVLKEEKEEEERQKVDEEENGKEKDTDQR